MDSFVMFSLHEIKQDKLTHQTNKLTTIEYETIEINNN